jgi:hypothetical protein
VVSFSRHTTKLSLLQACRPALSAISVYEGCAFGYSLFVTVHHNEAGASGQNQQAQARSAFGNRQLISADHVIWVDFKRIQVPIKLAWLPQISKFDGCTSVRRSD